MTGSLPIDKCQIVFLVFLVQGIGTLLPWNFVITAKEYFEDRLKEDNNTIDYATSFMPVIGLASKIPNIGFQAVNFFLLASCGSLSFRILFSIAFQIIMFVSLIALVLINFNGLLFYWLTLAVVIGINTGNGIYQNCLYGSAALLPPKFTNAIVLGNNISGVFSALLIILSIAVAPDSTKSAFFYFSFAVSYLAICFVTFIIIKNNPYYTYYKNQQFNDDDTDLKRNGEPETINFERIAQCLKKIWPQCLNTFLIFFVSLTSFPTVTSGVKRSNSSIPKEYFSAITCFLLFNTFAMIGNYSTDFLPKIHKKFLWIPVVLRFAFIPLFLICNYQPPVEQLVRRYPVFINDDNIFIFLNILHGFTSGWFSSLSMMYTPLNVDSKLKSAAGMVSSISLMLGIVSGINFSVIFPWIMFRQKT